MKNSHILWLGLSGAVISQGALASNIVIDGQLTEPQWRSATQFENFYQVVPVTLNNANHKVKAWAF